MSGHSKWANIKRKKARVDEKRGKVFTRIAREIIISARTGGGDPEGNMRLKTAIQKAKEYNIPQENIQRAIMRGTGEIAGAAFEETVYEGYGPGGVAVLLNIATDNRNRTASEIRYIFSRNSGNLGESGCVAWMFSPQGVVIVETPEGAARDDLVFAAIEAGAEDVDDSDPRQLEITTALSDFDAIRQALADAGGKINTAETTMVAKTTVPITDPELAQKVLRLMEALEDHDDVQEVFANFDIPEEVLNELV